jgi:hypothetical protein
VTDRALPPVHPSAFVALAEVVAEQLAARGIAALVIGGFALSVHNYTRATEDLDLGVLASPDLMVALSEALTQLGLQVEYRAPDAVDRLGGVIDVVDGHGAMVQIVNFDNPPAGGFPRAIRDALAADPAPILGSTLRTIPLPQLVALKLYAGGENSLHDVKQLRLLNPDADWPAILRLCRAYRLDCRGLL